MARSARTRRCYCLLPEGASAEDVHGMNCGVGGHAHLNFAELYGRVDFGEANAQIARLGARYKGAGGDLAEGEVEWLAFPRVLRLRRKEKKQARGRIQLNDLSAQVGAYLARAVRRKEPWAQVLLAQMRQRPTPPQNEMPT